jgi:hypothetical protein
MLRTCIDDTRDIITTLRAGLNECKVQLGYTALPKYLYGTSGALASGAMLYSCLKAAQYYTEYTFTSACIQAFSACDVHWNPENNKNYYDCNYQIYDTHRECGFGTGDSRGRRDHAFKFGATAAAATVIFGASAFFLLKKAWNRRAQVLPMPVVVKKTD